MRQIIATSYKFNIVHFYRYLNYLSNYLHKSNLKICYIGLASNNKYKYVFKFLTYLIYPKWEVKFMQTEEDIYNSDMVFVDGGNTIELLRIFRETRLDEILLDAYNKGIIMSGVSAGLLCWFKEGITDSTGELTILTDGLGFLNYSTTPHYSGIRKDYYDQLCLSDEFNTPSLIQGWGVEDGSMLL